MLCKLICWYVYFRAHIILGMHTPGVQTALLQIAPAYTGIITGIAFGFVAIFSIINKVISNIIVKDGSIAEWTIVFEVKSTPNKNAQSLDSRIYRSNTRTLLYFMGISRTTIVG